MSLDALYALIRKYEGLRLRVYRCPAGVPTIGYGHTGPEVTMVSPPITARLAEELMREDAEVFVRAAVKLSPRLALHADKLNAIADFCYNLGVGRYKASTLKRRVDAGNWEAVERELQKWVWGGGKKLPGLVLRRAEEGRLITR